MSRRVDIGRFARASPRRIEMGRRELVDGRVVVLRLLVVELADTTLPFALGEKKFHFARHVFREPNLDATEHAAAYGSDQ